MQKRQRAVNVKDKALQQILEDLVFTPSRALSFDMGSGIDSLRQHVAIDVASFSRMI